MFKMIQKISFALLMTISYSSSALEIYNPNEMRNDEIELSVTAFHQHLAIIAGVGGTFFAKSGQLIRIKELDGTFALLEFINSSNSFVFSQKITQQQFRDLLEIGRTYQRLARQSKTNCSIKFIVSTSKSEVTYVESNCSKFAEIQSNQGMG